MNCLWLALNSTSIEPVVANVIELSMALQVDGNIAHRRTWKVLPVLHKDDALFSGRTPEDFMTAYHKWLPTTDPRSTLTACLAAETAYFYNKSTLEYLKMEPEDLLDNRCTPKYVLDQMLGFLMSVRGKKWVLAGHNVKWIGDTLQGWVRRVDKRYSDALQEVVEFQRTIDTVPFFRAVAAFNPTIGTRGYGLKELAGSFGRAVDMGSTESKLEALLGICGQVIGGGGGLSNGQQTASYPIPPQDVRGDDRAAVGG